jgi:hypothetical protein
MRDAADLPRLVQSVMALFFNPASIPPPQRLIAIWNKEHSLISMTMVAVGLLAVLSWDSMFPDRRDVMLLAPLPVRPRTLFLAKLAALAVAAGLTIAALNGLPGLAWSFRFVPEDVARGDAARSFGAYWLTVIAADAFVFGSVLTAQGLAAQLPRRIFLLLSSRLQLAAFALFLGTFMLEPSAVTPRSLADPHHQHLLMRLPSYWFWGLLHALNGSLRPAMEPLVQPALAGIAIAGAGAATPFLLSYFRTRRRIAGRARSSSRPLRHPLAPSFQKPAPNRDRSVQHSLAAAQPPASRDPCFLPGNRFRAGRSRLADAQGPSTIHHV